jgi:hypothetical protein
LPELGLGSRACARKKIHIIFPNKKPPVKRKVSVSKLQLSNRRCSMNEVEDTGLAEVRQLKKEIRGSKDHLIVGIDVAKDKHHAFFGTARCWVGP